MKLELVLDQRALLRLTATPDKEQNLVQLKLVREESSEDVDECNLDFMVNGQVLTTPKAIASRTGSTLSHRVQIGRQLIEDFSTANKMRSAPATSAGDSRASRYSTSATSWIASTRKSPGKGRVARAVRRG